MKSLIELIDKLEGSNFNKEEISKLKIKYLEICSRICHSQKYSAEDAEYLIDHMTRVGNNLFDPYRPSLLLSFYELMDEITK